MRKIIIITLLTLVALGLGSTRIQFLRDLGLMIVSPLTKPLIEQNTGFGQVYSNFRDLGSLRSENTQLKQEVIQLQKQSSDNEALKRENETLRKSVGVVGVVGSTQKILTQVIVVGEDPFDQLVTVNAGSAQGVAVGQPAVQNDALIGKVISVRNQSSVVRLINSRESKIQVWTLPGRNKGLLIGKGNTVQLTEINPEVEIKPQNIIETNGLGGSLPQRIIIGIVDQKLSSDSEPTQSFSVRPSAQLKDLENIFILKTDQSE